MPKKDYAPTFFNKASLILPVFLIFLLACTPGISFSEDLGRHLLLGKLILKNFFVPGTNFLTYTYPDFPFINHHWLSQVLLYIFHGCVGLNGLIVIKMLLMAIALGVAIFAVKCKRNYWLIGLGGVLSAVILAYRAHIRPELFSFIFTALLLFIFERNRKGQKFFRWLIIPIMLIWANCHIYFIFGIGMIGVFAVENWLKKRNKTTLKKELFWLLGSIAVCIVNPNGIAGLLFPFKIFSNYGVDITENASPLKLWETALNPMLIALPLLSLMTLLAIIFQLYRLKKKPGRKTFKAIRSGNLIISIAALIAAWWMARNVPLLAICSLPVIINGANKLPKIKLKNKLMQNLLKGILYGMPTACSIILIMAIVEGSFYRIFPSPIGPTPFGFDPDPGRWDNLKRLSEGIDNRNKNVFSDYNIGSLVEYQLYPQKGYIDNRPEAFPGEFWKEEYFPAMSNLDRFKKTIAKRDINLAVFSLTSLQPTDIPTICREAKWAVIHLDENCIVIMKENDSTAAYLQEKSFDKNKIAKFEKDISKRLLELPTLHFYHRQVSADILVFRLYALICIGEYQRAWPYIWQLHKLYPDYQAVHELMRITAPQEISENIEHIYKSRAYWPLSAKQVIDWANHLLVSNKNEQAVKTIKRGRIFFPLSPILKDMEKQHSGNQ